MENLKKAIIFGGCGKRARPSISKLLNEDYVVVVVDNLSHSKHPKDWHTPDDTIWKNKNFVFYEEEAFKFMNEENMFSLMHWDTVIHRAKKHCDNQVEELIANTLLDAKFFDWILKLDKRPNIIATSQNTQIARDVTRLLQLPFQPACL